MKTSIGNHGLRPDEKQLELPLAGSFAFRRPRAAVVSRLRLLPCRETLAAAVEFERIRGCATLHRLLGGASDEELRVDVMSILVGQAALVVEGVVKPRAAAAAVKSGLEAPPAPSLQRLAKDLDMLALGRALEQSAWTAASLAIIAAAASGAQTNAEPT